jgi:hypothetical protein
MPVGINRDEGEEPGREQLLALQGLRRGVECLALSRGERRRRPEDHHASIEHHMLQASSTPADR